MGCAPDSDTHESGGCEQVSKLLGYANLVQGSMLMECEQVTNGIFSGDSKPKTTAELRNQLKQNCKKWQLLFQLDSIDIGSYDGSGDYSIMWGDCGRIYYYIKEDDLKNRNFDDCWFILQGA
jgi:uncharacterized protein YwqG